MARLLMRTEINLLLEAMWVERITIKKEAFLFLQKYFSFLQYEVTEELEVRQTDKYL